MSYQVSMLQLVSCMLASESPAPGDGMTHPRATADWTAAFKDLQASIREWAATVSGRDVREVECGWKAGALDALLGADRDDARELRCDLYNDAGASSVCFVQAFAWHDTATWYLVSGRVVEDAVPLCAAATALAALRWRVPAGDAVLGETLFLRLRAPSAPAPGTIAGCLNALLGEVRHAEGTIDPDQLSELRLGTACALYAATLPAADHTLPWCVVQVIEDDDARELEADRLTTGPLRRLELYLHKQQWQAEQYEPFRQRLETQRRALGRRTAEIRGSAVLPATSTPAERRARMEVLAGQLDVVTTLFLRLSDDGVYAETLRLGLGTNLRNLAEELRQLGLTLHGEHPYALRARRTRRVLEQVDLDLRYLRARMRETEVLLATFRDRLELERQDLELTRQEGERRLELTRQEQEKREARRETLADRRITVVVVAFTAAQVSGVFVSIWDVGWSQAQRVLWSAVCLGATLLAGALAWLVLRRAGRRDQRGS